MKIPTSKKELIAALTKGSAKLRREIVEFLSGNSKNKSEKASLGKNTDDSIIDVSGESYTIPQPVKNQNIKSYNLESSSQIKPKVSVPYWEHQYVYSFREIYDATKKQKEFYFYFKNRFLHQEFVELEDNTNYAFILLFDLLNEYENHKSISILENQLRLLGRFYPKTNSYALSLLARKMEARGDFAGAERINYEYQLTYYDYWKLGSKYKKILSLTDEKVKKLNQLSYSTNNFSGIEYCCITIIKLYLSVIAELEKRYKFEQTSLEEQSEIVADVIARKHFRYRFGSQNYKYCLETTPMEIRTINFKHCENAVREHYGHKRKLNVTGYYTHPEVETEFESRITEKLNEIISRSILLADLPDEETEVELYAQNTNRWKVKFSKLSADYNGNSKDFIGNVLNLGKLNKRNPSVENIFFEASKFISKTDRVSSLILYMYYLDSDLNSATFNNKQLTKTIQKSLFKTNEQLHDFQIIISEFLNDKDLEKAIEKIPAIYIPKRKKIKLDTAIIKDVQEQHSGTVELLNEYLQDEYEGETNTIKSQEINSEEIKIEISDKTESSADSMFSAEITFSQLQRETLELFYKNNLTVSHDDLENFAKSKNAFKNQLIDNLNEICYEILDDVLIEEEDEYYTITENYYQKLLAK